VTYRLLALDLDGTVIGKERRITNAVVPLLWFLISLVCSTQALAGAERLKVAFAQWPPYKVLEHGTFGGIDVKVLDEVARRTGLTFDYVECPWVRCLVMLRDGTVDMISNIAKTEERQESMIFLEPPTRDHYPISFYVHAKADRAINRYEDLYGLDIGVIRSSAYFKRFDHDSQLKKTFVAREAQLMDMLASRRLDAILGIGANLDYLIRETGRGGAIKKASFEIETADPAFVAISKKSSHKNVVPKIEKALRDMRRTNEMERIERRFLDALLER
jgi:polar amino acid transport system substrate-binding protein